VKLSVKSDYAARAVLGLARHYHTGETLKAEELASENGVPPNYLVQILLELKGHQLVKSVRGKEGGYMLARPPAEITLADVLRAIHGQVFDSPALGEKECAPELRNAWRRLQAKLDETASAVTFQSLLDEGVAKEKMYYI
jgi:Rrf2 family transcriptional regulator, cysteine metabolism repressor